MSIIFARVIPARQFVRKVFFPVEDFGDDVMEEFMEEETEKRKAKKRSEKEESTSFVTKDTSTYNKGEKLQLLEKDFPEVFGLLEEMSVQKKDITRFEKLLKNAPQYPHYLEKFLHSQKFLADLSCFCGKNLCFKNIFSRQKLFLDLYGFEARKKLAI